MGAVPVVSDGHDGDHREHGHHPAPPTPIERRVSAIESLLVEKGLLTSDVVDAVVETYERDVGPLNGAMVVARAWVDGAYRERLLDDATQAIGELGFGGAEGEHLVVLENTPTIHNVVVCTLCSCYPWPVLGLPPGWYKSFAYRSRMVREPRAVLAEFGTTLADDVEVRVWDSSADVRYMVLPLPPDGSDGMAEDELVALVTRDHMIGVVR
ncbi:MAG: nitrile hydratase subunit alpha [Acidimicrobiales bacterium]